MKKIIFSILILLGFLHQAFANDYYQLGSEWNKRLVNETELTTGPNALKKAMLGLGRVTGGATAFYIGKINGKHLGISNHHVYPGGCRGEVIPFPFLKKTYLCTNLIGTWIEYDATVFELSVPAEDEPLLARAALTMGFRDEIYPGQKLLTLGFGHHRNPQLLPVVDDSDDCIVLSDRNEFRRVVDPTPNSEPEYNVWSIAYGCESSQGDSGSAVLDRQTGRVVSIVWTTKEPKIERVQDSQFLRSLAKTHGPEVWTEVSYGVALPKLAERIKRDVEDPASGLDQEQRSTLSELIK